MFLYSLSVWGNELEDSPLLAVVVIIGGTVGSMEIFDKILWILVGVFIGIDSTSHHISTSSSSFCISTISLISAEFSEAGSSEGLGADTSKEAACLKSGFDLEVKIAGMHLIC